MRRKVLFLIGLSLISLTCAFGCVTNEKSGGKVDGVKIENEVLKWEATKGAREYIVEIKKGNEPTKELTTEKNELDIFERIYEYGQYRLRVDAVNDKDVIFAHSEYIGYTIEDPEFELEYKKVKTDEGYYVKSCKKDIKGKLVVPGKYGDKLITGVWTGAFSGKEITAAYIFDEIPSVSATSTFLYCKNLTRVKMPPERTWHRTFEGCESLREISVPDGVEKLSGTFRGCVNLERVSLPTTLKDEDYNAFDGVPPLEKVEIRGESDYFFVEDGFLLQKARNYYEAENGKTVVKKTP